MDGMGATTSLTRFFTCSGLPLVGAFGLSLPTWAQEEAQPTEEAPASSPLPGPAARKKVAGIGGFVAESRVVMPQRPDWPHRFDSYYAFPDRVRWWLSPEGSLAPGARRLVYRYGEQAHLLDNGQAVSEELLGEERFDLFLRMELRRALFLWPDGFEWTTSERSAQADLGATGRLVATLDEQGRPTSLSSLDREDRPVETLHTITWREQDGRPWPATLRLRGDQGEVWSEEVLSVRTSPRYLDSFFLPPDRREFKGTETVDDVQLQGVDVPARIERRFELGGQTEWRQVIEDCRPLVNAALEKLGSDGPGIESVYYFELDAEARPVSLVLRLAAGELAPGAPPPEGWRRRESLPALSLQVRSLSWVSKERLEALRTAGGEAGQAAGPAYLRVDIGEGSSAWAQLILPLGE